MFITPIGAIMNAIIEGKRSLKKINERRKVNVLHEIKQEYSFYGYTPQTDLDYTVDAEFEIVQPLMLENTDDKVSDTTLDK